MNNFGVIELASTKTTHAPGWAYVPEAVVNPALALAPSNRKRAARNTANPSQSDLSARQETKIRKELEALDRDINKDTNIAIPPGAGTGRSTKSTPNVRKILQSQKTFANHLDDYQALLIQAETNPAAAAALLAATAPPPKPSAPAPKAAPKVAPTPPAKRTAAQKRSDAAAKRAAAKAKSEAAEAAAAEAKLKTEAAEGDGDVDMTDAPEAGPSSEGTEPAAAAPAEPEGPTSYPPDGTILPAYQKPPPKPHPEDENPLLASAVPPFPTDEELRALMTAPPLSYLEAQARWGEGENRYPGRTFCEVCGFWGRVRCMKCGTRVCALNCLDVHREECVTRYGL